MCEGSELQCSTDYSCEGMNCKCVVDTSCGPGDKGTVNKELLLSTVTIDYNYILLTRASD